MFLFILSWFIWIVGFAVIGGMTSAAAYIAIDADRRKNTKQTLGIVLSTYKRFFRKTHEVAGADFRNIHLTRSKPKWKARLLTWKDEAGTTQWKRMDDTFATSGTIVQPPYIGLDELIAYFWDGRLLYKTRDFVPRIGDLYKAITGKEAEDIKKAFFPIFSGDEDDD
jgi:hypothetical protein